MQLYTNLRLQALIFDETFFLFFQKSSASTSSCAESKPGCGSRTQDARSWNGCTVGSLRSSAARFVKGLQSINLINFVLKLQTN